MVSDTGKTFIMKYKYPYDIQGNAAKFKVCKLKYENRMCYCLLEIILLYALNKLRQKRAV